MKPVVSETELLAAIKTLQDDTSGEGVTADTLCQQTGLSRSAVCNKLKRLIRLNRVTVHRALYINAVGRQQETFVYKWRMKR